MTPSAFGWEVIEQIGVAFACVALLIVYRKLNGIPNDSEDTREAAKLFGQSAFSIVVGLSVFQAIHWILHHLKG